MSKNTLFNVEFLSENIVSNLDGCFRKKIETYCNIQGPAEIPDDLAKKVVSGTVGVENLSLRALIARLKAFQFPWSAGL
jgi:hypothetical protein